MNAAAKVLEQAYLSSDNVWILLFGRRSLCFIFLFFFLISSAFGVIYVKDLNRRLTGEVNNQQVLRNGIMTERSKLLLEKSTWAAPARIQKIATHLLEMQTPQTSQVVLVELTH